jgi:fused signal recognition particle receptor
MDEMMKYLTEVSQRLGTGTDPAIALGGALLMFLFLALVLFALRTTGNRGSETKRIESVMNRLETLEGILGTYRKDMEKMVAQFAHEGTEIRAEVDRLRRTVEGGPSGSGGGGAPGGGSSGSGGGRPGDLLRGSERREASSPVASTPAGTVESGLAKTRSGLFGKLRDFFSRKSDDRSFEHLEEALLGADLGVKCVAGVMQKIKERTAHREARPEDLESAGREVVCGLMKRAPDAAPMFRPARMDGSPYVVLVVGVNGVGKTTTVAKLASRWKDQGRRVLMVAADTFRAGAVQQLRTWGERLGVEVVSGDEGSKPSTVTYTGMARAKEIGVDVVIVDTAGRLHTKSNLMQELEGVRNSVRKHFPDAPHDTILVVDGVSGQNALQQAREFNAAVDLTGAVVTKLDGSAKGGIVVAISQEIQIPIFYVGVGERAEDLLPFSPEAFAGALFSTTKSDASVSTTFGSDRIA